jgi:predicted PurR-regulated permease PerM
MFLPFLTTILMAFIFWQLFAPFYEFIDRKIKFPKLSSILTSVFIIIAIILPLFGVGSFAAEEAVNLYKNIGIKINQTGNIQGYLLSLGANLGISPEKILNSLANINVSEVVKKVASVSATVLQGAYQEISGFIFMLFVFCFVIYYLFLDGEKFIRYVFQLSPLPRSEENVIWKKFLSMSQATLKGTLLIGLIQGMIGGFAFWLLGISSPVLWGLIMAIFSALPLVGPVAIWLPAAIYLTVVGSWMKALILFLIGSLVIGSVDNFLRPKLIGNDTAIHPVLILISTFGGIYVFGALGFIVGPILITIFVALVDILQSKTVVKK